MSWTVLILLGIAAGNDCIDVLDRTESCVAPSTESVVRIKSDTPRMISQPSPAGTLAPRLVAVSGMGALFSLGAAVTAGFYERHLAELAATGKLSVAEERQFRLYSSISSLTAIVAGIGASLVGVAGGVFAVFDPGTGGLQEGIQTLRE